MSNQAVGTVYQTIIDEVINSSRVDFEESGVEESALEELRQGWQQKLSQLDVARFPWDPKSEPPPPAQSQPPPPPAAPAATGQPTTQAQFSPNLSLPVGSTGATGQNGVKSEQDYVKQEGGIKQEPGAQGSLPALPNYNGIDNKNSVAASRAAQQLQLQYGVRAAGSINAIQDRMGQQQQSQNPQPPQGQQKPQQQPETPNIGNGQTDGPADEDDYEGILMQRNKGGTLNELGRIEIDRMLHEQIAARAKAMEGGGLMLPLKEATKNTKSSSMQNKGKGIARYDGGDDDDDIDDEDAINSDLDDPEDSHDEDEVDDEGLGHIMLCMYDKVQRVKNKWYVPSQFPSPTPRHSDSFDQ
ncbi:transcription factor IIA subunit alpha [Conoideocrella luteorostrata]|uniref:Transcription initiation factor IIA large subunit n=1 Tax=Conoideocrella luteorostrata TaxID=1105319 RepID=A0AAJ0CIB1_9HYPO|nr:transcription factor IIA subunit alpha [Conoideocrella luteorostrata]